MIKIYGSPKSSAGRVYWMLEEIGLEYEPVKINMREKEHKGEAYLKLNPNGKVPCLTDGDFVIWESMAINNYLADKYAPDLLGKTPEIRGHAQQWSYWSILELQKHIIDIFIQKIFVPDDRRDTQVIEKAEKQIPPLLKTLDNHLAGKHHIAGPQFTIADINVASIVGITSAIQFDISEYKNIQHWLHTVHTRPAFKKYIRIEL